MHTVTEAEIADLNVERPQIPRPVDIELLTAVEKALERSLKDDEVSRRDARSAFWGRDRRDGTEPHTAWLTAHVQRV
jgi:hypothetical protein